MVSIPSGTFVMGMAGVYVMERPPHQVSVPAFALAKTHVTRGQFATFVSETGYHASGDCFTLENGRGGYRADRSWRDPGFQQDDRHPVVCVSWDDAKAYTEWLTRKTGRTYRLPTEAEWEYAARAGIADAYYWGSYDFDDACKYANLEDLTTKAQVAGMVSKNLVVSDCSDGFAYTSPVASFKPNAFGLYDMIGNAWEWTEDCYHEGYKDAPADGKAWKVGDCGFRVLRGSSWNWESWDARLSSRFYSSIKTRTSHFGFRLARDLP